MLEIASIRKSNPRILAIGSYSPIIQSVLDFDFLSGKNTPSVVGIIKGNKHGERFFWGKDEILIPYFKNLKETGRSFNANVNYFLNVASARRVLQNTQVANKELKNLIGGVIFAEDTPEKHSLSIYKSLRGKAPFIIGPSSIGILVPEVLKLGAIGGVSTEQLLSPIFHEGGNIAVICASGGMTNELLNILSVNGKRISFCVSFGGDRFPITPPTEVFLAAEKDDKTEHIIYFGELGGTDEYELAELIKSGKIKKPIFAYIAGSISEMFKVPPQFGHAKAMAKNRKESAKEKTKALSNVGVTTADSFKEYVELIKKIDSKAKNKFIPEGSELLTRSEKRSFASSIAYETDTEVFLLGDSQLDLARKQSFSSISVSLLLGRKIKSKVLEEFTELVFKLFIDNGPSVSGAVNTIIAARAGKDMVSSLTAGLLTIGSRFGGAVNEAARNWISGVESSTTPSEFVESFATESKIIAGIGHKKYRSDNPDPRVDELIKFSSKIKNHKYLQFAKEIERVTTNKKANLILNADGAIAAVALDILSEKEGYGIKDLKDLVEAEFFNALFIIPRTVGFIAHFLDQKRLDEGLFRLPANDISYVKTSR